MQTYMVMAPNGHGSGVALNDHCVLTAAHVVESDRMMLVRDDQVATQATLKAKDESLDVAVVCSDTQLDRTPVRMACQMPEQYAPVFTIGYPLSSSLILTTGSYMLNSTVTAAVAPGNSGGGVFTEDGRYIGMVDGIYSYRTDSGVMAFPHLVVIVEAPAIRQFLDLNQIGYTPCS